MTVRLTKYQEEEDGFDEIHDACVSLRLESPDTLLVNAGLHSPYYFHVLSSDPDHLNTRLIIPKAGMLQRTNRDSM
jgi:hypothetical protein